MKHTTKLQLKPEVTHMLLKSTLDNNYHILKLTIDTTYIIMYCHNLTMIKSPIRIGVLTNMSGHSMQQLSKTAHDMGIIFETINFNEIDLSTLVHSNLMKEICSYDIIYYRTGMRDTIITELIHILEELNIPIINGSKTHTDIHKKIQQALIAGRHNIPAPRSILTMKKDYEIIAGSLGKTFVVKPDTGSKGKGIALISSQSDLDAYFAQNDKQVLYQEFIQGAEEYRVYTLGVKSVASYKKIPSGNDFRANLHTGASMEKTESNRIEKLYSFGEKVASSFKIDISGIDILYKNNECILLEVNLQPGWEQLDINAGVDFSKKTIEYIIETAKVKSNTWQEEALVGIKTL